MEAGADGVHAESAHHLECHGEEPDVVAAGDGNGVCKGIGEPGLDGDRRFYAKYVRRVFTGKSENTLVDA